MPLLNVKFKDPIDTSSKTSPTSLETPLENEKEVPRSSQAPLKNSNKTPSNSPDKADFPYPVSILLVISFCVFWV